MSARILNREFQHPEDGWYQIEPSGEHPNRDANIVQVIDTEATGAIVNRFNADADAGQLSHGNEMLIDHEHFSHESDKETRAFGWLTRLANRADGIYGQIRWTTTGKAAVDGGDYRFFSTEYDPADLTILNSRTPKRVRPLRLDGLTLTNRPNNRGGKPITNSRKANREIGAPGNPPAGLADKPKNNTTMKLIASKLGLSADASEEGIVGELDKLFNRVTGAKATETENLTLTNRVKELETTNKTLIEEQCDALLDAHGIKADDKVRNRLRPVLATLKNREERIATLADFGFKPGAPESRQTKLLNRDGRKPEEGSRQESRTDADDAEVSEKIRNRAAELKGSSSRTFDDCWKQATREVLKQH